MKNISVTTQGLLTSTTCASDASEYQTKTYDQKGISTDTSGNKFFAKSVDYKVIMVNKKSVAREEFRNINKFLKGDL